MNESLSHYAGLSGRVAVITGASGSIGGAVCLALARHGTSIAATGRNKRALDQIVADIQAEGGKAIAVTADVNDSGSLEKLRLETEKQLGQVNFVAAIAGGGGEPVALSDLSLDRWRQTIDLNLTSAFLTLKTFLPAMAERGQGAVVTIASLAGRHVIPQAKVSASPAYAAAKSGLLMLTRQAAREYAGRGVRINAISPASVTNARIAGMPESMRQGLASSHPLGRIGQPEDIAEAVLFLLSGSSSWMTGATIDINGGFAML